MIQSSLPSLPSSSYSTVVSTLCTAFPSLCCSAKSNKLILDPIFYNSGDPELKNHFGPLIIKNTINCDGYNFSYSANIIA